MRAQNNLFYLSDVTLPDLTAFRATWDKYDDSWDASRGVQTRIQALFNYMHESGRIAKNPATGMAVVEGEQIPTLPLTDKEYEKLLTTIETHYKDRDLMHRARTIIRVMRHTGMSVRDTVTLPMDHVVTHKGKTRVIVKRSKTRKKNPIEVSIMIPRDLADDLARVKRPNPASRYFLWTGNSKPSSFAHEWSTRISNFFKLSGVKSDGTQMKSHRLCDTFAKNMLLSGVPLEEVSWLLGHGDIKITQKHYATWVQERQDRLDKPAIFVAGTKLH